MDQVEAFCRKWKVTEFSLFGSVLRNDFGPESDIDVLVELSDDAPWSLYEWVDMIEELKRIFGRHVDLVDRTAVERSENYIRRKRILGDREVLYAA